MPTVSVTCVWAGVDNAWEQEKLEARKMLENAAESHTSGVSMKVQSDGVAVGHVFEYPPFVRRTGTRTREHCVRDQPKRAWEVQRRTRTSPLRCVHALLGALSERKTPL
jgi:hypothetical protein